MSAPVAPVKSSVPKTGADFDPFLIFIICFGALAVAAILSGNFRKKKKPDKEIK